jgi:hypothetical protein
LLTLIVSTLEGYIVWAAGKEHLSIPRQPLFTIRGPAPASVPAKTRSPDEFQQEFNATLEKSGYGRYRI